MSSLMNGEGGRTGIAAKLPPGLDPIVYGDYLKVDQLLSLQECRSDEIGQPAHEELLFITVHQVYELWFKQILHELDSVRAIFEDGVKDESLMLKVVQRLGRVVQILKLCVDQITVLETMTPLDFAEFRDLLIPSSGFQSLQFRLIENKLGVTPEMRVKYRQQNYLSQLNEEQAKMALEAERETSLLQHVNNWLARTPGSQGVWWNQLERNITAHQIATRKIADAYEDEGFRADELKSCEITEATFRTLFDKEKHDELYALGQRRLTQEATKGALMIFLNRDLPRFQIPFSLLTVLQDIDSKLMEWRHRHVAMVQRMIGSKMGTGGSSGYHYLRSTVSDRYKVFLDLSNLSTFLVERSVIPEIDEETRRLLVHNEPRIRTTSTGHM